MFTKIIPSRLRDVVAQSSSGIDSDSTRSSTPFDIVTLDELEPCSSSDLTEKLEVSVSDEKAGPTTFEKFRSEFGTELNVDQAIQISRLVPAELISFKFDAELLTGGKVHHFRI